MKLKKNLCAPILILFINIVLIVSCKKEKLTNLTPDNLTECPTCATQFRESARLEEARVEHGNAMVFQYKNYWSSDRSTGAPYTGLFFEVREGQSFFDFDENTIASEKAVHITMCPFCNTIPLKPVGGKLKGKRVDKNRWLVEAAVALAAPDGSVFDTLAFKHYFTRN